MNEDAFSEEVKLTGDVDLFLDCIEGTGDKLLGDLHIPGFKLFSFA